MALYLTRFSYTPETWAKLIEKPEDGYNLWEAPDNVSMAAAALALAAGGALTSVETTPLLTVEETLAALQKASSIRYRRPGEGG